MSDDSQGSLFQDNLNPKIRKRFNSLCSFSPNINNSLLVDQINNHVKHIHLALEKNEFLNLKSAQQAADKIIDLINHLDDYSPDQQSLIIGVARYFVLEEDLEPDTKSPLGFDDDIKVLNYVLEKLGKQTLEK